MKPNFLFVLSIILSSKLASAQNPPRVKIPEFGCGTYEITGMLKRDPVSLLYFLASATPQGLPIEFLILPTKNITARDLLRFNPLSGTPVQGTFEIQKREKERVIVHPLTLMGASFSTSLTFRKSKPTVCKSEKLSGFFKIFDWLLPQVHAQNIAFIGANSYFQNFSAFETSVDAFYRGPFNSSATVLNSEGKDSKGNLKGRVLRFVPYPTTGGLDIDRTGEGFPKLSPSQLTYALPERATRNELSRVIKATPPTDSSINLLVSDHGSPEGFMDSDLGFVTPGDLKEMFNSLDNADQKAGRPIKIKRVVHLQCFGATFFQPALGPDSQLLAAFPENQCHLAFADGDEVVFSPEFARKTPLYWEKALQSLNGMKASIWNLKTLINSQASELQFDHPSTGWATSSTDSLAAAVMGRTCQGLSPFSGSSPAQIPLGEKDPCSIHPSEIQSHCKSNSAIDAEYAKTRNRMLQLQGIWIEITNLRQSIASDFYFQQFPEKASRYNQLIAEQASAVSRRTSMPDSSREELRSILHEIDREALSNRLTTHLSSPVTMQTEINKRLNLFPQLLHELHRLGETPGIGTLIQSLENERSALRKTRSTLSNTRREAQHSFVRKFILDPASPPTGLSEQERLAIADRYRNLLACESGEFGK